MQILEHAEQGLALRQQRDELGHAFEYQTHVGRCSLGCGARSDLGQEPRELRTKPGREA